MTPHRPARAGVPVTSAPAQRGAALIISLLMMLLITLIGLTMSRSIGMDARITGNTGEHQHSLQAAQDALQYDEWWLTQLDNASTGVNCNGATPAVDGVGNNTPIVCNNSQTGFTSSSWTNFGTPYTPSQITVASSSVSGANTYYQAPASYIYYLGAGVNQARYYQITAIGYGGNANTVSVVQSTYQVSDPHRTFE